MAASAQLNEVSVSGGGGGSGFHYDITVTNTGTTNIGTFWFAWQPGSNFLPSVPTTTSSPTGWINSVTGSGDQTDGSGIEWTANSNSIAPGHSLTGFDFSSPDSPTVLVGTSPTHPLSNVMVSEVYSGAPFSDAGFELTVNSVIAALASSTTTVASSQPTITHGHSVTLTATVAPTSGSGTDPTGTVTFLANGTSIGTAPVAAGGIATLNTSTLPDGSLSITAQYGGDGTYLTSTSPAIAQTVNPIAPTTTTLTTSQPSISSGGSVIFTATVAPVTPNGTTPTGSVTFSKNGTSLGAFAVQSDGTAQLVTATLPIGSDPITAVYSGDSNFAASTSAVTTETVTAGSTPTTTALTTSSAAINSGDTVILTATVAPTAPGGATPTGTVTFTLDGNPLGTQPVLSDGTAVLSTASLPVGSGNITAVYSGDAVYAASTSPAIPETVTVAPIQTTTTTLTASSTSVHVGDTVTFTATVTPATPGGAIPTGTITFTQDGNALGSQALQSDGTAAFSTTALPLGSDNITASYGGDNHYAASASAVFSETVATPPTLVSAVAKSTVPATLIAGFAAHGAVTVDVTNTTGAALKGKVTFEVFASTDGSIDGSSIQLMHVVRAVNVKTTKPTVESLAVKIAPATLPAGSYTLLTRVVDLAGNNNDSSTGPTLSVAAPFIALTETVVKTTIPVTAVAGAKSHAAAVLRIANGGNITTPLKTTVSLFATLSGVIDTAAVPINSVIKPLRIKAGKSVVFSIPLKTIPAIAAGAYTVVAQVTDPNGQITLVVVGVLDITAS